MNIDEAYATNRDALDQLRRIGLGWGVKHKLSVIGHALYLGQEAFDELAALYQAVHLVIEQFAEIGDASWPTRGMKAAIDRLEESIKMENVSANARAHSHYGDPCVYCNATQKEADIGPCPGRPGLDRDADHALTISMLIEKIEQMKKVFDLIHWYAGAPQNKGRMAESLRLRLEEITVNEPGYWEVGTAKDFGEDDE